MIRRPPRSTLFPYTTLFRSRTMPHVVLLGDSIFDNKSYVGGGPDVIAQVRDDLPPGWKATLCAVDGADRKSTRLNSSHANISYAVFCLKKKSPHLLANNNAI